MNFRGIYGDMMTSSLRCARISLKRPIPNDRPGLTEFGRSLSHWLDMDFNYPSPEDQSGDYCIHNLLSFYVLTRLEKEGLKDFSSLEEIAGILETAENPEEFDGHAEKLDEFFERCKTEAEHLIAVGGPRENPIMAVYARKNRVA